ncbi:protein MAK16-like protein [Senna tora]|uniref:Protein MAK16 homolog n=1 Tax=Senna tora TaxID=362788 RepID=A0A834WX19_9FABA|nr:protein MAK16-like protein [Senna tora]
MQHDEVIWQVIRHNHCSYMTKITTGNFCRNIYNVTGICNRSSCPLANSRYATIRDIDGVFYLYMKTIERAHMPKDLWERVKLPRNYEKALEIIDKHLMYWPKFLVHKTKQRLTKMTQMRIRMRKLILKTREKIMTTPRKEKKREARREEKAEIAAGLEKTVENELLERLRKGVYGNDIVNYPLKEYNNVLDMEKLQPAEEEGEEEPEVEYVEGYDELEEEDDMEDFAGLRIHDSDDNHNVDDEDVFSDAAGTDDDEAEVVVHKKLKRNIALARKPEKDVPDAKLKARVLVEVEGADGLIIGEMKIKRYMLGHSPPVMGLVIFERLVIRPALVDILIIG